MTPEFAARVFEAFERERTSTVSGIQGTGLGMAITKSIVDLMGGTIEVTTAPGAGTEFAVSPAGHFDAVLMDIQMPVMNGYEATAAIRALGDPAHANIPIVAMTANAFAEDVKAAQDVGMNAHISKPLDVTKMVATLKEILR